jgi:tetratricopeptide (TPR) repeat protein
MLEELLTKAQLLIQTEQYEQARRILMIIIRDNPNCTEALNDLAVVEIMEGKYQSGLELFGEVIKIDPKNEDALNNIEYVKDQIKQKQQD